MGPAEHDEGGSLERIYQVKIICGIADITGYRLNELSAQAEDVPAEICQLFVDTFERHPCSRCLPFSRGREIG